MFLFHVFIEALRIFKIKELLSFEKCQGKFKKLLIINITNKHGP